MASKKNATEKPLEPSSKRSPRRPSRVIIVTFLICCFVSLTFTFFHVSLIQNVEHKALLLIDRGYGGGLRPVLASDLRISTLQCNDLDTQAAQEMVYWQDIPLDSEHKSPFYQPGQYLTFEPDEGGFNNIRMSMETVLALAHAMGRTLVLPPEQRMYLLHEKSQRNHFSFNNFFPLDEISSEEKGLDIITMEEFLLRNQGNFRDATGQVSAPPKNRTNWDGDTEAVKTQLWPWLRNVTVIPLWDPNKCLATFPASASETDVLTLNAVWEGVQIRFEGATNTYEQFIGNPTPVHGSMFDRLSELLNGRKQLCLYNETLQHQPFVHFAGKEQFGGRLLVHFYAFLFFADWKQDLWTKRFVRDHVRYNDEIQCAAARIVQAVRQRARKRNPVGNPIGDFDSFHIRRGEFQYKRTRVTAKEIYDISKDEIPEGSTVYVATDEKSKDFFKDMAAHYDLVFLSDYMDLVQGLNPNFFGMVDQLVASRSRTFFGCWFSTFTSYINRIRGYHADKLKSPGFAKGVIQSYYYALPEHKMKMREYWPLSGEFYAREFPIGWRNIDHGIGELPT